jgi:hypothetical protein
MLPHQITDTLELYKKKKLLPRSRGPLSSSPRSYGGFGSASTARPSGTVQTTVSKSANTTFEQMTHGSYQIFLHNQDAKRNGDFHA